MKKKKNAWLAGAVTAVLFLLLVFFTLTGDRIYNRITPKVPIKNLSGWNERDGERYVMVPREALTAGNAVYIVTSSQGFSRTIYRIWKKEVEYIENPSDLSTVLVSTRLPDRCMVVTQPESAQGLADGDQVLLQR